MQIRSCSIELRPAAFIAAAYCVLLYLASAFIGNEWCYLLPAALLSSLIVGITLPLLSVLCFEGAVDIALPVIPNTISELKIHLQLNKTWRLLAFLLPPGICQVHLLLERHPWQGATFKNKLLSIPLSAALSDKGLDTTISTAQLPRGVFDIKGLEIRSCFPLAFAWCRRTLTAESSGLRTITVHPPLFRLNGHFLQLLTTNNSSSGQIITRQHSFNQSINLRGLRDFSARDNLSHIHWASTAKAGKFMVRQFESESSQSFDLILDLELPWSSDEQFELAVTAAYCLASYGQNLGLEPSLIITPQLSGGTRTGLVNKVSGRSIPEMLSRVMPFASAALPSRINHSPSGRILIAIAPAATSGSVCLIEQCGQQTAKTPLAYFRNEVELCCL
ncbi:MAG: DUF58 domain-containing protein [Candidatus Obscuribacterales bacterium]|nr:DUF58 domain-containing protein [Candidatus Obscuribacterales bacterium]